MTYSTIRNYDKVVKLANKEYMQSLVDEGLSYNEIARRLAVNNKTVGKWVRSHGIVKRGRATVHDAALSEKLAEIDRAEGRQKKQ